MTTIAFIGLGNMGGPMAANLVKAGHRVIGFDLVASAREQRRAAAACDRGERRAEAVAAAEVVITMLPAGKHVLGVLGRDGCRAGAKPGALLIDCSTDRRRKRPRARMTLAADAGLLSVDAPVSGGVGGARAATLTFMVRRRRTRPSRAAQADPGGRWASASCIAAARAPGRRRKSATT